MIYDNNVITYIVKTTMGIKSQIYNQKNRFLHFEKKCNNL